MAYKKRIISIMVVLIMLFSVIVLAKPAKTAEGDVAKWTVMVYMTGSDLESTISAAATTDLTEMIRSEIDAEQVKVVVATGGAKSWFSEIPNDSVNYYQISADEDRPVLLSRMKSAAWGILPR